MLSFKVHSNEMEDRLLVPFYQVMKITKKYPTTVGSLSEQITNGIDIRKYKQEGTLYLRASDIKRCQVDLNSPKRVSLKIEDVPKKIRIKEGDILITRKGTVGITSIVSTDCKNSIIGTEIIKVRLKHDAPVSPEYLYTLLNSKIGILQVHSKLTGTLSRGINHPSLKTIKIPILSPKEQKQIEGWVKEAKEKHTKSIEYLNKAFSLVLEEINSCLTKEVDHYKITSKDLEDMLTPKFYYPKYVKTIDKIKKKFKTQRLGDIADIDKGEEVGSENYRTYLDKVDSDVPFIRTSDLPNYEIDDYPDYYVDEGIYEKTVLNLEKGDIIFSKDGRVGLTAMSMDVDKCILASGLSVVKPHNKEDAPYIFAMLSSFVGKFQALQRTVVSSTLPHFNIEKMADIEIPILEGKIVIKIKENVNKAFELKREKKLLIRKAKALIENVLLES